MVAMSIDALLIIHVVKYDTALLNIFSALVVLYLEYLVVSITCMPNWWYFLMIIVSERNGRLHINDIDINLYMKYDMHLQ